MKIAVLGSTGSIGRNTLEVAGNLDDVEVYGITANKDIEGFRQQLIRFKPKIGVIADNESYEKFIEKEGRHFNGSRILSCTDGLNELVQNADVDVVVNGVSGLAGLDPTILALKAGKKVASANKESIIMGWNIIKENIKYEGQFMPVDSEHSAVFQSLKGENAKEAVRIILTASGGAVYNKSREDLENIKAKDCLLHPVWDMGYKITIDSATLMNKGLEVIEARNLFEIDYDQIDVYIHPQSIIHGMVEYVDGSLIAHMAVADMKIPIQYALTHPQRKSVPSRMLSIDELAKLEFKVPDTERFPCLDIAVQAGKEGGAAPIVLCAADEVAVDYFVDGYISFKQIPEVIKEALDKGVDGPVESTESIENIYRKAREMTLEIINK